MPLIVQIILGIVGIIVLSLFSACVFFFLFRFFQKRYRANRRNKIQSSPSKPTSYKRLYDVSQERQHE
jgi:hypothetical protein